MLRNSVIINYKRRSDDKKGTIQTGQLPPNETPSSSDEGRGGIQFGTTIAYDDAYNDVIMSTNHNTEYMKALPTLKEERRLLGEEDDDLAARNDLRKREIEKEEEDMGRIKTGMGDASHPNSRLHGQEEMVCPLFLVFQTSLPLSLICLSVCTYIRR